MGYLAIFRNENQEPIIGHSDTNPRVRLLNTRGTLSTNDISVFSFTVLPDNPIYNDIQINKTLITIVDTDDGFIEFEGRVVDESREISETKIGIDYKAEDRRGFLRDSPQTKKDFKGTPKALFELLINRHNTITKDDIYKQFDIGDCEVDTYREFVEGAGSGANVVVGNNKTATIKQTAKYIYASYGGPALNIASYIKGVPLIVRSSQVVNGKRHYLLYRTINGVDVTEGIVSEEDILETNTTLSTPVTTTSNVVVLNKDDKATIKQSAKYIYAYYGGPALNIAGYIKGVSLTVSSSQMVNGKRHYLLFRMINGRKVNEGIVSEDDIIETGGQNTGGNTPKPLPPAVAPKYVEKQRTIEVELTYSMNTYEAIKQFLLEPYEAELEITYVEEVPTIHIRNRIENQTDEYIRVGHNIEAIRLSTNLQDIYSGIIPIGTPPAKEEVT